MVKPKFSKICYTRDRNPVVQKLDSAIHCISNRENNCPTHWIEIYPMDTAIHLRTTGTRLSMFGASVNITIKRFPTEGLKNGIHHFTKEM